MLEWKGWKLLISVVYTCTGLVLISFLIKINKEQSWKLCTNIGDPVGRRPCVRSELQTYRECHRTWGGVWETPTDPCPHLWFAAACPHRGWWRCWATRPETSRRSLRRSSSFSMIGQWTQWRRSSADWWLPPPGPGGLSQPPPWSSRSRQSHRDTSDESSCENMKRSRQVKWGREGQDTAS